MLRRLATKPAFSMLADDFDFVSVAGAGGADDILLDHHAAMSVDLYARLSCPTLPPAHPRRLQSRKVVEHDARERQHPQVLPPVASPPPSSVCSGW